MADESYRIPWAPLDMSPGINMYLAAKNAQRDDARADEYLKLQRESTKNAAERESNALKRQEENDKYRRGVDAFNAMPMLHRAALRSVGMANANPYGVRYDETRDLPANVEGPEFSPQAEEARFAKAGVAQPQTPQPEAPAVATPQDPPDFSRPHMPSQSVETRGAPQMVPSGYQPGTGMDGFGEEERQRAASNLDLVGTGLNPRTVKIDEPFEIDNKPMSAEEMTGVLPSEVPEPARPLMMQAAVNTMTPGPEGKRRVFGTFQGNRFEVPEQNESTGLGAEYDAIYNRMLEEPGITPSAAFKAVLTDYQKDQAEKGRDARLTRTLGFRDTNREDQQTFQSGQNELYKNEKIMIADRDRWNTANNRAKIAASAPGLKADAANARDMSVLERTGSAIRQTGQFNKLAASDKTVRGIMVNIASGTVPLQHADAQIQLARFFRQAQPTEGEMHLLYNNLGGTKDKWNQFVAKLESGDLSAEQMRQLRVSAKAVQKEHAEDIHRFREVAKSRLGPGRGFDMMPDQAQGLYDSMLAELGIHDPVPLHETEGGTTLGSGKRQTIRPRGEKRTALDELEAQIDAMGTK